MPFLFRVPRRPCYVCLVLASLWSCISTDDPQNSPDSEKASIRLKVGALFDVRARHLTDTFQTAVNLHNSEEIHQHGGHDPDEVGIVHGRRDDAIKIIFEPVITFVDVTDSFAVSNAMCDLIAHDVIAIVGITNASSLPTIQSYSATFHVPFLSLGSSQNVTSSAPFQLSLRPPVMAAVVDLVQHQGCASALYVYDSDEGLLRIQDLFQAINVREAYLELDVRRVGDKVHGNEFSKIIGSLHPRRDICLILDVERLDIVAVINLFAAGTSTVKDIILVTLDADVVLSTIVVVPERRPAGFNISGLQLVPSPRPSQPVHLYPHFHHHQSFRRWSAASSSGGGHFGHQHQNVPRQFSKDFERPSQKEFTSLRLHDGQFETSARKSRLRSSDYESGQYQDHSAVDSSDGPASVSKGPGSHAASEMEPKPKRSPLEGNIPAVELAPKAVPSSEALIVDCLKVLTTALADLWDTLGDVFESTNGVSQEDMTVKCTNFVVEKNQYGDDLMDALRLVHIQGDTRYISFDTSGKREDYTLSVLSVKAGSRTVRNEGEWSSVSGLTLHAWSRDGVKSYTIFGNMSEHAGRKIMLGVME